MMFESFQFSSAMLSCMQGHLMHRDQELGRHLVQKYQVLPLKMQALEGSLGGVLPFWGQSSWVAEDGMEGSKITRLCGRLKVIINARAHLKWRNGLF